MQMIPMLENDAGVLPLCARRNHALAALAEQALIAEAELTPKPGLVDRRGSGAHSDLSLNLMRLSAKSLRPFFAAMGAIDGGQCSLVHRQHIVAIHRYARNAVSCAAIGELLHAHHIEDGRRCGVEIVLDDVDDRR